MWHLIKHTIFFFLFFFGDNLIIYLITHILFLNLIFLNRVIDVKLSMNTYSIYLSSKVLQVKRNNFCFLQKCGSWYDLYSDNMRPTNLLSSPGGWVEFITFQTRLNTCQIVRKFTIWYATSYSRISTEKWTLNG